MCALIWLIAIVHSIPSSVAQTQLPLSRVTSLIISSSRRQCSSKYHHHRLFANLSATWSVSIPSSPPSPMFIDSQVLILHES